MSSEQNGNFLLALIPSSRRKPEQVACWERGGESPTYTLLREPFSLNELNEYDHCLAIWRDNETLTYVRPGVARSIDYPVSDACKRSMSLEFDGLGTTIRGKTDNAIAETAAFFMRLAKPFIQRLSIRGDSVDFSAAGSHCLNHIFGVSPSIYLEFCGMTLSSAQSTILASRHPRRLSFRSCGFEDGGSAFIDALENRDSSIESIMFEVKTLFTEDNLKRLPKVRTIDYLRLPLLESKQLALLPFSVQVDSLSYDISSSSLVDAKLQPLNILPNKLSLTIYHDNETFPTEAMLSLLRRVAELGHLVELCVGFCFTVENVNTEVPDCIVQEVIRATLANSNLKVLELGDSDLNWDSHFGTLAEGIKDHKQLFTLMVPIHDKTLAFGPDFSCLRQFLTHNRNVTVMDESECIYTDWSSIDELYALNSFYRGSAGLVVEPSSERSSLVATTILESASDDFQRSALLLAHHADALYKLVQLARLDEFCADDSLSQSVQDTGLKRKRKLEEPRATKRISSATKEE